MILCVVSGALIPCPILKYLSFQPLSDGSVFAGVSGESAQLLQATLACNHARRDLNPRNPKYLFPPINPIMTKKCLRRVSTADSRDSLWLRAVAGKNLFDIGYVGLNLYHHIRPINHYTAYNTISTCSNHHYAHC